MNTSVRSQSLRAGWLNQLDPVWLSVLALFLALAVVVPEQARTSLGSTLDALIGVVPFLLLSALLAAYAKASGADGLIARAFEGRMLSMIVLAALAGALSPFCSCGVIPLIAALLAMGVPLAPVMAFWLASPIMDPSMFVLTAATLGPGFAVAKTLAAVGLGLLGALGTLALQRAGLLSEPLREGVGNGGCAGSRVRAPAGMRWGIWSESPRRRLFLQETLGIIAFLGKWLTLAFALESLMVAYVPNELVVAVAGGDGFGPVLRATLIGVPAYLNGYAALPLVGALLGQGMAPGAAMAFLLAGGVSSIPAAIAVFALARPPVFAAYLGFALIGSLMAGLLYGMVA